MVGRVRKELVVGSRSRRLNTLCVQQTPGGLLQTLLCASIESKRCWKGQGRGWPWGGRLGCCLQL